MNSRNPKTISTAWWILVPALVNERIQSTTHWAMVRTKAPAAPRAWSMRVVESCCRRSARPAMSAMATQGSTAQKAKQNDQRLDMAVLSKGGGAPHDNAAPCECVLA